jgi:phthiocerol/phenolphthiocerol synthesis type-I polyketide synthase E
MQDVSRRIADLSPERRKALEALLEKSSVPKAELAADNEPLPDGCGSEAITAEDYYAPAPDGATAKARTRRFYDSISSQLATTEAGRFSYFLNFGYVPDGSPEYSAVALPTRYINKNCVRLVLELVGDCDVRGQKILDIGCGRGGTVHVLKTFFQPALLVGVDLSVRAVSFCVRAHRDARAHFLNGDAEALPFKSCSFDVITNVESSHSYPTVQAFYGEVYRLLVPGGCFLYTDLFPLGFIHGYVDALLALGFELERDRDITRNVLRSCDESARVHLNTFGRDGQRRLMSDFIGMPGSGVYENMRSGRSTYRIFKLRKPGTTRVISEER